MKRLSEREKKMVDELAEELYDHVSNEAHERIGEWDTMDDDIYEKSEAILHRLANELRVWLRGGLS